MGALFVGILACDVRCRTNQPFFEDPFDVAAGGSTLTRATQEGMLINNPALLPYGGKFFRWLGTKTTISTGKASVELVRGLVQSGSTSDVSGDDDSNAFVNELFSKPIHFGFSQALSLITNNGGITVFGNLEPDLRAYRYGDSAQGAGVPNVVVRNETYGGAYASVAGRSAVDWFAYGLTFKYLLINETTTRIDLIDESSFEAAQSEAGQLQSASLNKGVGVDVGTLFFAQGKHVDFRFALTVGDVSTTRLTGSGDRTSIPRTINAGVGFTLHTQADAIHFSADLRDAANAYEEELFKRLYLGTRILIRTYLGLAVGVYHGWPTYGAEIDLLLFRLAASSYTREYGDRPGVDSRPIYQVSISTGLTF